MDQHRVASTVRGSEVFTIATRPLRSRSRRPYAAAEQEVAGRVDLAACHRALRAQRFDPGNAAHFRLFALASSARDRGSGTTEAQLLIEHIGFWQRVLSEVLPTTETRISLTVVSRPVLAERLRDTILPTLAGAPPVPVVGLRARRHGAGYYTGVALGLLM